MTRWASSAAARPGRRLRLERLASERHRGWRAPRASTAAAAAPGSGLRQAPGEGPRLADQHRARIPIAAMPRRIDQRPNAAGAFARIVGPAPSSCAPSANSSRPRNQIASAVPTSQETGRTAGPSRVRGRARSRAATPRVHQLLPHRLQPGLGRRAFRSVQLLQPLAPPGEADLPDHRLRGGPARRRPSRRRWRTSASNAARCRAGR